MTDEEALKLLVIVLVGLAAYLARFKGSAWCFPVIALAVFISIEYLP